MKTRMVLLVLALMSAANAHAALWQIEYANTGDVLATFKHNPGGLNPGPAPYFEDITLYFPLPNAFFAIPAYVPAFLPNDDSHLSAASALSPLYFRFVADFATPLTAAGGVVGVDYAGTSADGTWCRGDAGCYEWGPSALVARSIAEIPVPATFLLIVAALSVLVVKKRGLNAPRP